MKSYEGSCYIGVVGSEEEIGECRDSIENMTKRSGDELHYIRATKGYAARQKHVENFLSSRHEFILFMDQDQVFPVDTLERLRSHKQPYITGLYMRRHYAPILPVWYADQKAGVMPMKFMVDIPWGQGLVKLGASGWGCVLIHRDVFEAVAQLLKGEDFIIEDDMDIYPYNLDRILTAMRALKQMVELRPPESILYPALDDAANVLFDEIRPLRIVKDAVGSDIRFPFYAKLAGYQLYGDPSVQCSHMLAYPLSPDDFRNLAPEDMKVYRRNTTAAYKEEVARLKAVKKVLS